MDKNKKTVQKKEPVKTSYAKRRLKSLEDEEWAFIKLTNHKYAISNYGRVKSYTIYKEEKILKSKDVGGFSVIIIKIQDEYKTCLIHRLVAEHFVPKDNPDQIKVTHIDWNLKNSHYKNLMWLTMEENRNRVSIRNSTKMSNRKNLVTNSKLKEKDILVLKQMLSRGVKQNVIAKLFHISEMQVTRIKRGENWKNVHVHKNN